MKNAGYASATDQNNDGDILKVLLLFAYSSTQYLISLALIIPSSPSLYQPLANETNLNDEEMVNSTLYREPVDPANWFGFRKDATVLGYSKVSFTFSSAMIVLQPVDPVCLWSSYRSCSVLNVAISCNTGRYNSENTYLRISHCLKFFFFYPSCHILRITC